jgi:hypothetical protein
LTCKQLQSNGQTDHEEEGTWLLRNVGELYTKQQGVTSYET